jgi:hypothetical protein
MNYGQLLEHSYYLAEACDDSKMARLDFLGDEVFNFTTYDGNISALFAEKALEVCKAITEGKTFDYQKDEDNYKWYLLMCNMPFFNNKLEWGASIRGAWWEHGAEFEINETYWMYNKEGEQVGESVKIGRDDFIEFIKAMVDFTI